MDMSPEIKWIKITETSNAIQAELMKSLLEDAQIEVILLNKQDSMYLLGEVELYVKDSEALTAHHILSKSNREH
jgi:hypothetical protein